MFLIKTFDASFPTVELWLAQTNLCVCIWLCVLQRWAEFGTQSIQSRWKGSSSRGALGVIALFFFCPRPVHSRSLILCCCSSSCGAKFLPNIWTLLSASHCSHFDPSFWCAINGFDVRGHDSCSELSTGGQTHSKCSC